MLGLFGVIAVMGAAARSPLLRMAGALCILAASFAISRSDRAHQTSARSELIWAGRCGRPRHRRRHPLRRLLVAKPR